MLHFGNHFETHEGEGNKYLVPYKKTYFPNVLFAKRSDISGLRKVSELTIEGINYIEETIEGLEAMKWAEFLKNNKSLSDKNK